MKRNYMEYINTHKIRLNFKFPGHNALLVEGTNKAGTTSKPKEKQKQQISFRGM
jgi:hypothetical protein